MGGATRGRAQSEGAYSGGDIWGRGHMGEGPYGGGVIGGGAIRGLGQLPTSSVLSVSVGRGQSSVPFI